MKWTRPQEKNGYYDNNDSRIRQKPYHMIPFPSLSPTLPILFPSFPLLPNPAHAYQAQTSKKKEQNKRHNSNRDEINSRV